MEIFAESVRPATERIKWTGSEMKSIRPVT